MSKKPVKKKPAARHVSPAFIAARAARQHLRRLQQLHRAIAAAVHAVERSQDAANRRLERLVHVYAERCDKVFVDRAAWNTIRDEHAALQEAVNQTARRDAERARELAGATR